MSTEIKTRMRKGITVCRYYGGKKSGSMYQITQKRDYKKPLVTGDKFFKHVSLSKNDIIKLYKVIK